MAAQIGPDWVQGIAGFGDTVSDALRDLAYLVSERRYTLQGNAVGIDVAGEFIEITALPSESSWDILMRLAAVIEERGYQESDFAKPNWPDLANEERIVPPEGEKN